MLLMVSVLLEQYAILPFFPWIGELGGFRPMLVFLDIPLELPKIDWLPVSILFSIGYAIAIAPGLSRTGQRGALRKKVWQGLTGWWFLLLLILAGGGSYYFVQDYFPKQVGNGIDSFGLRADITLPWPYENCIHLHGSMVMLIFFLIGAFILSRFSRQTGGAALTSGARLDSAVPAAMPITEPAAATPPPSPVQYQQLRSAPIPAQRTQPQPPPPAQREVPSPVFPGEPAPILVSEPPPTCRYTTPPPVAIIMPRPAIRRMHPCVVAGIVEPSKSRRSTNVLEPMGA
jgi:hypothetical protein